MGYYKRRGTNVIRDNHFAKDHNGIWRRTLLIEQDETNIIQYSANIVGDGRNSGWEASTAFTSWENVASCIEGGSAFKGTSSASSGGVLVSKQTVGWGGDTYSGKIEVASGIFERVDQSESAVFVFDPSPTTNYTGIYYNFATDGPQLIDGGLTYVDYGYEDLGIGPNGGKLVRIWIAYDSGDVNLSGEYRYIQWRTDDNWSVSKTGILHHAGLSQHEGAATEERQNPTSPIVTAGASGTRNRDAFYVGTSLTPQLMTIYVRMKVGQLNETNERLISVGDNAGAGDIYVDMYLHGNSTVVVGNVNDLDNAWWDAIPTGGTTFSIGDTVESRLVFDPTNDRFKMQSAVNGVKDTESAWNTSPNLNGGSFDTQNVWIGGWSQTNDTMCGAFYAAKICSGEQTMEFMRGYKE